MDVQELISSGKLELYVAGVLSEREMADVAAMALEYKEVADEIEIIEKVMIEFLSPEDFFVGEADRESQIGEILDKIHAQPASNVITPIAPAPPRPATPVKSMVWLNWVLAAMIAGLVIVTGLTVWFGIQDRDLTKQLADMQTQDQQMTSDNRQFENKLARMEQQVNVMRNILTKRVELTNVKGNKITGQDNYILAYWNPQSQKLMLVDAKLPDLSAEQQYQLWALYDGKPIDAGVFDYKTLQVSSSFQKDIANAQAFAVTVEPKGGSKTPTLSNLCMMGKL